MLEHLDKALADERKWAARILASELVDRLKDGGIIETTSDVRHYLLGILEFAHHDREAKT